MNIYTVVRIRRPLQISQVVSMTVAGEFFATSMPAGGRRRLRLKLHSPKVTAQPQFARYYFNVKLDDEETRSRDFPVRRDAVQSSRQVHSQHSFSLRPHRARLIRGRG